MEGEEERYEAMEEDEDAQVLAVSGAAGNRSEDVKVLDEQRSDGTRSDSFSCCMKRII